MFEIGRANFKEKWKARGVHLSNLLQKFQRVTVNKEM